MLMSRSGWGGCTILEPGGFSSPRRPARARAEHGRDSGERVGMTSDSGLGGERAGYTPRRRDGLRQDVDILVVPHPNSGMGRFADA
jgi:hypothetical protein